jgi:hypothetical protein
VAIPVHVMVRPRAGDFLYSAAEAGVMLADIAALRAAGVAGKFLFCYLLIYCIALVATSCVCYFLA